MSCIHFIPFEKIPKGSRVCLYGAGEIGKAYYEQNALLKWCKITLVVDGGYKTGLDFPTDVFSPEMISREKDKIDYVLVAVGRKSAKKSIINFLHDIGVSDDYIVDSTEEYLFKNDCNQIDILTDVVDLHKIRVAWCISKAMGDQIISLKPYQALQELCPCIETDIFSNGSGTAENVYYNQNGIRSIKKEKEPNNNAEYDLVISVGFTLFLKAVRYSTLSRLCPELYDRIKRLHEYQISMSPDTGVYPYTSRIIMDRAYFLGKNRYTMLAEPQLFDYKDKKVLINIDASYKSKYEELNLPARYITFNCEAGSAPGSGAKQLKEWPREYYVCLVKRIKEQFPDITIVQLGSKSAELIKEADQSIRGESLELVKYILQDSLLHIDCESGLPHLASQLGTKCCVLFGPTPAWFLSYDNNINIEAEDCHGCKGLISDWYNVSAQC